MCRPRGLYLLDPNSFPLIYGLDEQRDIAAMVDIIGPPLSAADARNRPDLLARADVIFSGSRGPLLDHAFFKAAPNVKAVFHGAETLIYILTAAVRERGILVTSAVEASAVPVAEYTLATILFSLKHGWRLARETRAHHSFPDRNQSPGCYGSTVGLISLGAVARKLRELLKPFDLKVLVCDPSLPAGAGVDSGAEFASLEEIFELCDVVSLHTPDFPEMAGMINGKHFASMKPGATFINTAGGELVREPEMIAVLSQRSDLQAVLDVTCCEVPAPDSPLYKLRNVMLTPRIAGSVGFEYRRMGRCMVEELSRYLAGEPLKYAMKEAPLIQSSHRLVAGNVRCKRRAKAVCPVN